MLIHDISDKVLKRIKRDFDYAEANRPGGLLVTEQTALDKVNAELKRRVYAAYCKAYDC